MFETHPLCTREREEAHALVMAHGWNSTAYQILNPGILYWFSSDHTAVVGFIRRGSYVLVAGAPVCAADRLDHVIAEFEADVVRAGLRLCYVCAGDRLREAFENSAEHSVVAFGAQPVWDAAKWENIVSERPSLRAQLRRARNKDVVVTGMNPHAAANDPEIRAILREWLERRPLPPLHFLTEPEVFQGVIDERVVLVARSRGALVAYLVASPIPGRHGYLIEELARSLRAPNGTSELLIDCAMRTFGAAGHRYVTLGLVALARNAFSESPWWLRSLMYFARAHANRFYNFRGLEQFRTKMRPVEWEQIYLISRERHFSPRTLYAVGGAFSGISPLRAILIGLLTAVRAEWRGLISGKGPAAAPPIRRVRRVA